MSVHDVPRVRWAGVLERFNRAHRGWLTRVVRVGPGAQLISSTRWHPLGSVTALRRGVRLTAICVNLQGGPAVSVRRPRTLGVDRREDGAERGLEVDADGGEFVRIVFRATARPEELDGIAPAEMEQRGTRVAFNPQQPGKRSRKRGAACQRVRTRSIVPSGR